jgi:hypothetical protein
MRHSCSSMSRLMLFAAILASSACLLLLPGSARAAGCTTSWASATGGDWNAAGNWDNGVPDPSSDVCITLPGTYTVAFTGTIANIRSLTLGGASGSQTLTLAGDVAKNANLIADATADIGANGVVVLTSLHPDHTSAFWPKGGTTSYGTIVAEPGAGGGVRDLRGPLTNNGTIDIQYPTRYGDGDVLVNQGTVNLAAKLDVPVGATFTSGVGSSLAGSDRLVLRTATFNLVAGTISNPNPIELEDSSLNVTGTVPARFLWHGTLGTLTGGLRASGQKLTVEGTCSAPANVTWSPGYSNKGTILLTSTGCARLAGVTVGTIAQTFVNLGTLSVQVGAGGSRSVAATLENRKRLELGAGATLDSFAFTQLSGGSFTTFVNSLTSYGRLTTGPATLSGKVAVSRTPGFSPGVGSTFTILSSSGLNGSFSKATGAVIAGTKYFLPAYTSTDAQLVVANASLVLSPTSGPAGTVVTLNGAGFPPNSTVTVSFKDHLAIKTSYPAVTTDSAGAFSVSVAIPSGAASGSGSFMAKSAFTGVQVTKPFVVTP